MSGPLVVLVGPTDVGKSTVGTDRPDPRPAAAGG